MQKGYYMYLANSVIQSKECLTPKNNEMWGIKSRAYCEDTQTLRMNWYNVMLEDPYCRRPYPDNITFDNSFTAKDGECFRLDDHWYRMNVLPYDGRSFDYSTEWDGLTFK